MDPPERDSAVFVDESARTSFDSPSVGAVPDSRTGSHEEGSKTAAYSGQSTPKNPSDRPPLGHRAASRERELRPDSQAERKKSPPDLPAAAVQALGSAIGGADAAPVAMPSPGCRQQPWMDFGELTAEQNAQEDIAALGQAEGNIEIDNDESTFDAGYASDANSLASTSLTSSVRNYTFENGRRYHKFREGRYHFPNDDVEQEREDMKHAMYMMLCQQLHFAPIGDSPHQILDVGTGTGIWAIEMGEQNPSASVLGIDLSPIQPNWVPPNVRFVVDDAESVWLHPRDFFCYVHLRHTIMAIRTMRRLLQQIHDHLRPGGWVELQEVLHVPLSVNDAMPQDHPVAEFWRLVDQGLRALGIADFHVVRNGRLASMVKDTGFRGVTERVFHIPIGVWPKNRVLKTVGLYWRTVLLDGLQAIALGPLTRGLGWSKERVELFLVDVRRAYYDNSAHMYMELHIVYGQKPDRSPVTA